MNLHYEESVNDGKKVYLVDLPYELNESFKETFKSAKWRRDVRRWQVGSRSKEKLEAWIAASSQAAARIEESKALDDQIANAEETLNSAREAARRIEAEIGTLEEKRARLAEIRGKIAEVRAHNAENRARLEADKAETAREQEEIEETIFSIIDRDEYQRALSQIRRNFGGAGRVEHDAFDAARQVMRGLFNRLKEKGICSRNLAYLADMNFNRPDRDSLRRCPPIWIVEPVERGKD